MAETKEAAGVVDPFTQMWRDLAGQWTGQSAAQAPPPSWSEESLKQMQRAFLDALAKYCDEFMRSPHFMNMMKQMMDNSLAFKQQVDRFLADAQRSTQASTHGDVDDVVGLLRTIEERIVRRIDDIEERLDGGEPRPKGRGTPATKKKAVKKKRR